MSNSQPKTRPRTKRQRQTKNYTTTTPSFTPFVNDHAGLAATGVRVGFPANRTVDMIYADANLSFTCTAGAQGKYQYRINSAYDPNFTATGHQPMAFDQWALFYNHYVVESCHFEFTVVPDTADSMFYAAYVSDDSTIPTYPYEFVELGAESTIWGAATQPHIFRGKVDFSKFFNRPSIASDPEMRATTIANPVEQAFLNVIAYPVNGSSTVVNYFAVKLVMKVRFMEPRDLAPSLTYKPPTVKESLTQTTTDDGYTLIKVPTRLLS